MANEQNLIPLNKRAKSVQREIQSKGGKARAEKIRANATFKEIIVDILNETGGKYDGADVSKKQVIVIKALKYLLDDKELDAREYAKMFELIRDTIGEKPMEKVAVAGLDDEKAKLDELINQRKERNEGKR